MRADPRRHLPLALLGAAALAACAGRAPAPAPAAPSRPGATTAKAPDACPIERFEGPWVIEGGEATLTCDDGTAVTQAAGGHVAVVAETTGLWLTDGPCRHRMNRQGCTLQGLPGERCEDDGTTYVARTVRIEAAANDTLSFAYALEHADPEHPGAVCVAGTKARLVRAARRPEACPLPGRWESGTAADGRPGLVALTVADGRCTFQGAGQTWTAPCTRDRDTLTVQGAAEPTAAPGGAADCPTDRDAVYELTFSADCMAVSLEERSEPCAPRARAVAHVYMPRARGR